MSDSPLLPWIRHWILQGVSATPQAFRLYRHDCLPSTNSYLWEAIGKDLPPATPACATVAIARRQVSGRGQWGRRWQSPVGGLYLSVALPPLPIDQGGPLMLSCAWGIAAALRQFDIPVQLKWPNDLVIGARKLGGILIESRLSGSMMTRAVVGIGINWRNTHQGGISIAELETELDGCAAGKSVYRQQIQASIETLTAAVLTGIAIGNGRRQHQGVASILPDYEALMTHRGQRIVISHQGQQVVGRVVGIVATGQLRIHVDASGDASESALLAQPALEITADPSNARLSYNTITSQRIFDSVSCRSF